MPSVVEIVADHVRGADTAFILIVDFPLRRGALFFATTLTSQALRFYAQELSGSVLNLKVLHSETHVLAE